MHSSIVCIRTDECIFNGKSLQSLYRKLPTSVSPGKFLFVSDLTSKKQGVNIFSTVGNCKIQFDYMVYFDYPLIFTYIVTF